MISTLPAHLLDAVHAFLDDACILAITDVHGTIVFANDSFCRVSGYEQRELVGQNHRILRSGKHSMEYYREMWKTVAGGATWRGEICNRKKDGELYWVDSTISPIRDSAQRITHYVALRIDITATKEAQQRLRDQEHLVTVGQVADGIAHDINNLLTHAICASEMLPLSEPKFAGMLRQSLSQMALLTQNLRDLAQNRPVQKRRFNLGQLVESATRLGTFAATRGHPVAVQTTVQVLRGCEIDANEGQILEVVLNLCTNAIEVLQQRQTPEARLTIRGAIENGRATIRFQDNGPGVDESFRAQLFRTYSSTKGKGRGKGLATARQIALAHGGDLVFEPGAGGACFRFTLPVGSVLEQPARARDSRRLVLVMEDDAALAQSIAAALHQAGFEVLNLGDQEELIVRASQFESNLSAAVLDSAGTTQDYALVGVLRQIRADLPIILTSARLEQRGCHESKHGLVHLLPKPFYPADLVALIAGGRSETAPRVMPGGLA